MRRPAPLVAALLLPLACSDPGGAPNADPAFACTIPEAFIQDGGPGKDGIPALVNPTLVGADDPSVAYLEDTDRVMGIVVDGNAVAVPINVLWWHEVVNLDVGTRSLAVTHCPLTGSSLTFERAVVDGSEFGVSGLLFLNNLMMYDRTSEESLWPQMTRGARCGPRTSASLTMYPTLEIEWAGWRALYGDTRVVTSLTGFARDYRRYPYGTYDTPSNPALLFPMPNGLDDRRPPKERVLGIPAGEMGGLALPFGLLDAGGPVTTARVTVGGNAMVVFWDRASRAAAAYLPGGRTFSVRNGAIVDGATGSTWSVSGIATTGSLAGTRLAPVADTFVAYWFAWAAFYPDAALWAGDGGAG
ncbi:MAG TPA: DUF3179 domain-containing protein [Gemmatimonadales bacterium]